MTVPVVHTVSMSTLIAQIELRVRFRRISGARVWIGTLVMRLAAWVAGCAVKIDTGDHAWTSMAGKGAVPIRLDVRDPAVDQVGQHLRVSLDGVEMQGVVAYDIQHGTIDRHAKGPDGRYQLTDDRRQIKFERLTGDVAVDWVEA